MYVFFLTLREIFCLLSVGMFFFIYNMFGMRQTGIIYRAHSFQNATSNAQHFLSIGENVQHVLLNGANDQIR